jgi:hypothetical protein
MKLRSPFQDGRHERNAEAAEGALMASPLEGNRKALEQTRSHLHHISTNKCAPERMERLLGPRLNSS